MKFKIGEKVGCRWEHQSAVRYLVYLAATGAKVPLHGSTYTIRGSCVDEGSKIEMYVLEEIANGICCKTHNREVHFPGEVLVPLSKKSTEAEVEKLKKLADDATKKYHESPPKTWRIRVPTKETAE